MRFRRCYLLVGLLAVMNLEAAEKAQAIIIDTGSTNRPGLQVTMNADGSARVESRGSEPHTTQLNSRLCQRFFSSLRAAAPLSSLPAAHCVKSVSFGSRLFVEYNGERSPDLNCPVQSDPKIEALKQQALEILQTTKGTAQNRRR